MRGPKRCGVALAACLVWGVTDAWAAPDEITTSPVPLLAVMSSNGRFVAWTNEGPPDYSITIVDRQTATSTTLDLPALTAASTPSRVVVLVSAISNDGRYLTYRLPFWSTTEQRLSLVRFDRVTSAHLVVFSELAADVFGALAFYEVATGGKSFAAGAAARPTRLPSL